MAQVWSACREFVVGGDSYRIYSHGLTPGRWTWWCPLLGIGGEEPWDGWSAIDVRGVTKAISNFLLMEHAPA